MSKKAADETLVRAWYLVPPQVDQALRDLAKKGRRPLASEVRYALEEYVARENRKSK